MAMVSAGRILILPKGSWDNLASYDMLDMVTGSNNKAYLARKASVGVNPTTDDGTYWQMFGSSVAADGTTIVDDGSGNISVNIDNDTIKYDSVNGYLYVDIDPDKALEDLTDVAITSATNGQALIYDSIAGKWKNGNVSSTLAGLTDTNISTPTNGQVLKYNSTSQKWENGADSGAVITLTVSCDSAFQGETVTISKGGTSLTESVGAGLSVSFTVPELGTWTISNSLNSNTDTIDIQFYGNYTYSLIAIPDGSTVTPTDDIQTLLNCANIWDKNYTTLSELLADTTTLQTVISSNNAIDYLVRSTTWATDMCADSTAMSYIGLNNYASNTLLADSTWASAICNSTYFESVLNVKVPTMTSNNTPSGQCVSNKSAQSGYGDTYDYFRAFDGDTTTYTALMYNASTSDGYLGYDFGRAVKIYLMTFAHYGESPTRLATAKIQISNDLSTFTDMSNTITFPQDTDIKQVISTPQSARYWLLGNMVNNGNGTHLRINEIQFYGRADV